jgi:hypothetical protein
VTIAAALGSEQKSLLVLNRQHHRK